MVTTTDACALRSWTVALHNVAIKQADKIFALENVEALKLENVTINGLTVNSQLEWKRKIDGAGTTAR